MVVKKKISDIRQLLVKSRVLITKSIGPIVYQRVYIHTFIKVLCASFAVGIIIGITLGILILKTNYFINSTIENESKILDISFHSLTDAGHLYKNTSVADKLYDEIKVLCFITTSPENHKTKSIHVKRTWGRRCNKFLIMSSIEDNDIGTIGLDVNEGRNNLWAKTKEAFKYIYKHYLDEYDWILKADDDTYVILENLRYMLYRHSSSLPLYFGLRIKSYMSGGAGYVLSSKALKILVESGLSDSTKCRQDSGGYEDVEVGKCLENLNVTIVDSLDDENRERFYAYLPENYLIFKYFDDAKWIRDYGYHKQQSGMVGLSDYAISFHYVKPIQMYNFEYFLYHLTPYGIVNYHQPLIEINFD